MWVIVTESRELGTEGVLDFCTRVFLSLCSNTKLFCIHEWDCLCWAMKNYLASLSWIISSIHTGSRIVYGVRNEKGETILKFLFLFMLLLGCLCNKLTIINYLCLPCRSAAPKQLQGSLYHTEPSHSPLLNLPTAIKNKWVKNLHRHFSKTCRWLTGTL